MNGFGERTGNANLISILPALQLKLGYECVEPERLRRLTETAHLIDEICNLPPDASQPYVGRNAFAHKGGLHVAGVEADSRTFEHMEPEAVGNSREILISELAGKGTVMSRAAGAGIELDETSARTAIERIKQREHAGYHYEAADASFELLLRREAGTYEPLFRLESFRVVTEKRADGRVETEATIKVWIGEERYMRTAEGDGPVNALDRALRAAITEQHPEIAEVELTNFKVRILDEHHGTGAVTRVLLDSSDGHGSWGSIGVSANVIEASWEALVDSLEYAFQPKAARAVSEASERIPLARPVLGEREEELVLEVLRSGMLSLGPMLSRFEALSPSGSASPIRSPSPAAPPALHLAVRELGWGAGDEVLTTPLSLRRLLQLPALRGRQAGLLRRRPGDADARPGRGRGRGRRGDRGPAAGPHLRLPGGDRRARGDRGRERARPCSRTARRRSARSTPRAARPARAATPPPTPSTPTSR